MKKINDFSPYINILPYASEIFGVYQPMLGWKSKRANGRIQKGFSADLARSFGSLYSKFKGDFEFTLDESRSLSQINRLAPSSLTTSQKRTLGSFVMESVANELPSLEDYDDTIWDRLIQLERMQETLNRVVIPQTIKWHETTLRQQSESEAKGTNEIAAKYLDHESAMAGYLLYLKNNRQFDQLKTLFYKPDNHLLRLKQLLDFRDPLDYIDPFKDIDRAGLSPIGIVHLFRQYFFEFDTFLGSPVSHVWLSPGANVELVEISTRKTIVERTFESSLETTLKTEKSITEEDEISDAVKQDNKSDTKFGVNTTANQNWIGGSAGASTSIDINNTQSKARETTHKRMRQQTEKLSTEIRKNYKTTFKTVTETTDTSSKRYILANTTDKLINYELRRKMRQVGVQVQDIGTYLCWQTYVDDPGRQLGISKLVHLAKGPEVGNIPPPEEVPMALPITTELNIDIPFIPKTDDALLGDNDIYRDGKETSTEDLEGSEVEAIKWEFTGIRAQAGQADYHYGEFGSITFDYGGNDIYVRLYDVKEEHVGQIAFSIRVNHVNFHGSPTLRIVAKITWHPTNDLINQITTKNKEKVAEFNEKSKYEYERAFVEAARERIKLSSKIESRKFEELREEERIVVYRSLIQDMLTKDIPMPDDRTRHVVSELLNTIFDVDKMLYFVAPEWWRPRLHHSHQGLGGLREVPSSNPSSKYASSVGSAHTVFGQLKQSAIKNLVNSVHKTKDNAQIASIDNVTWGGTHDNRVDNYYITDESAPAKFGSSLGWLLQLDGDNLRNAFLNAPWVKVVIPIRPGKERAALNWLQRLHVEGIEGMDDQYVAPPEELAKIPHNGSVVTVRDAIEHLCDIVAKKHEDSLTVGRYPKDEINDDNRVSTTPVEKVYEHGFYPLQGGFRTMPSEDFEIFDQWVEILPTDQVVPVEVTYDPKTGRQI